MLPKSYTGLSDRDLIAQPNANLHYQIFCGVRINPLNPLVNFKIVSEIRCETGGKLNIDKLQEVLVARPEAVFGEHIDIDDRCNML